MPNSISIFSTEKYNYMRYKMEKSPFIPGFVSGDVERKTFPDGERYQRIKSPVIGEHVAIVGGTISDSDTLEMYDLACAAVKYGAEQLSLVIPYYGYSTMERPDAGKSGEVVTAKTRARLFSSLPTAPKGNKVFLLDLHSEGIPFYFEGNIQPIHVYAKEAIIELIKGFTSSADFVIGSTDAGRAKWVESLANDMGVTASFVFKKRLSGSETKITGVSAQVSGKQVVVFDDMLRTGGSAEAAIMAYHNEGAKEIFFVATHGVCFDGFKRLAQNKIVKGIGCTDSHATIANGCTQTAVIHWAATVQDGPFGRSSDFLKVSSVADLLAKKVCGI